MMDIDIDAAASQMGEELIQEILKNQPLEVVEVSLDAGYPIWYQNVSEGISALHAAAYVQNAEIIKFLLDRGAIWNAVDNLKNTAGDIALSFNNETIYTLIRDAGIRSELLLGLLDKRPLAGSSSLVFRATDDTASGSSDVFLSAKLKYITDEHGQSICLLKGEGEGEEVGVMMGWEEDIMYKTVQKLYEAHPNVADLKVLNVGFGLGIIDGLFQTMSTPPTEHVIIEAHPDVLKFMKENGWYEKKGVRILEGKWQEFIGSKELLQMGGFDVVYTDTFSENYTDLRDFFDNLPDLLADGNSRFSFFNGLGATNAMFYDVYTRIAELHLDRVGLDITWSDVDVSFDRHEERWGQSREYFSLPLYRLPLGKLKSL